MLQRNEVEAKPRAEENINNILDFKFIMYI